MSFVGYLTCDNRTFFSINISKFIYKSFIRKIYVVTIQNVITSGRKIRPSSANSSRPLDQFVGPATRKLALRHRVSVSPSERPLRLIPATAPRSRTRLWTKITGVKNRRTKNKHEI